MNVQDNHHFLFWEPTRTRW